MSRAVEPSVTFCGKEGQWSERALIFAKKKTEQAIQNLPRSGAGSGGRTRTVSLPLDFESSTSANSITPALTDIYYKGFFNKMQPFFARNGKIKSCTVWRSFFNLF